MKQAHDSSDARQAQRLDAFWRKALAAAPEAPIDAAKLAAARTAIFAAAQQHSAAHERRSSSPWHALRSWWSEGAQAFAPPRWATGLASITLASLVLVLWYQRLPEPAWDFDNANIRPAAAPAPASAPAPIAAAPMAEPAPQAAMAEPPAASALARPSPSARQAPEARLQRAPNAPMAEAAPASKATGPERNQPQPTPPMPAAPKDALRAQDSRSSSVTLYSQVGIAASNTVAQHHALLAQVKAADGVTWRANAQSLFAPLDAAQANALLALLQPLAQQAQTAAPADPSNPPEALSLLQRNSLQLLLKQSRQVSVIAHIVASPHYQIDWLNAQNEWLASTPMGEAAYNRITTTVTSHAPSTQPALASTP